MNKNNLTQVGHALGADARARHYGHSGGVLWLTGLSASGKSTLAMGLERALTQLGYSCYVLDGDNVRSGLNANLGFHPADRTENIRRVGEVAALFADAGLICITAFISPYRGDRAMARTACRALFQEVYVATDLATCEGRDPKGLYKKARTGQLPEFTGVSAPYEEPLSADFRIDNSATTVADSLAQLLRFATQSFPLQKVAR